MIETRSAGEQLTALLQRGLAEGRWSAGSPFPSERELARDHGISRTTANKVLTRLRAEGWLSHRRGIGHVAAERPTVFASLRQLESFTDFAEQLGLRPSTRVTAFVREAAPPPEAPAIWPARTRLIRLERSRLLEGESVILEMRWLPADRFPRLRPAALAGSFYRLCRERYQLEIAGEQLEIEAASPPAAAQGLWPGPSLGMVGQGFDAAGGVIWHQRLFYRGDRFRLLSSTAPGDPFPRIHLSYQSGDSHAPAQPD